MELIETLNERLRQHYGHKYDERAEFRVVWSEEQYEVRYGEYDKYTAHGIYVGREVGFFTVPKYRQWLPTQWVLERLTPVPDEIHELTTKLSYEPLFGFQGRHPQWEELKCIIDNLLERQYNPSPYAKYKIAEEDLNTKEATEHRVKKLEKELFEDSTDLQAALHCGEAVTVPALNEEK